MEVERAVRFPSGQVPGWSAVTAKLAEAGESHALRMIDGLPAFPDELPPDEWSELRVSLSGGMVTLRRGKSEVRCVTWGSADPALTRSWDVCCWAVAAAGDGEVVTDGAALPHDRFRESVVRPVE